MTNKHYRMAVNTPQSTYDRLVVIYRTITMQLNKVITKHRYIVQRIWTLRLTGQLHFLPAALVGVNVVQGFLQFLLQLLNGCLHIPLASIGRASCWEPGVYLLNI